LSKPHPARFFIFLLLLLLLLLFEDTAASARWKAALFVRTFCGLIISDGHAARAWMVRQTVDEPHNIGCLDDLLGDWMIYGYDQTC
jgi:hypothetical protein